MTSAIGCGRQVALPRAASGGVVDCGAWRWSLAILPACRGSLSRIGLVAQIYGVERRRPRQAALRDVVALRSYLAAALSQYSDRELSVAGCILVARKPMTRT
jgi:hypothetical protein